MLILTAGLLAVYGFKLCIIYWNEPQIDVYVADYLQRSGTLFSIKWARNIKMKNIIRDKISVIV